MEGNTFTESLSRAFFYTVSYLHKWLEGFSLNKYDGLRLQMPCWAELHYFPSILQNH